MKRIIIYVLTLLLAFGIYLASGIIMHRDSEDDRMIALKPPFSRLTQAVNSTVRYKKVPPGLDDQATLKFATSNNPSLLAPFEKFPIRIKQIGSETVLLLCTPDNQRPLLEDISSTPKVDKERWRSMENASGCDFTINQIP